MPILITNESTNDYGGIQRYIGRLATTLAANRHEVILIEPSTSRLQSWPGVRSIRFACGGRFRTLLSASIAYLRESRRNSGPTIASIWYPSGFVAAILPHRLRGRLTILAHGSEICPSRRGFRRAIMRWTFRRADVVIANSRYTRGLLIAAGIRTNIIVIPCGVDAKTVVRQPAIEPRILAVGRLIARKGFDRLIEAMPEIRRIVPGVRLRLVGDGPLRDRLKRLAEGLGIANSIDFLGAIDDIALESEYASAVCFAMPSRRIADDVEGFGIVYMEAAMAELPSIGGRESGAGDAIADGVTGTLVDGESASAIATAVLYYLTDERRAAAMGCKARERALAEFSWERITQLIEQQCF